MIDFGKKAIEEQEAADRKFIQLQEIEDETEYERLAAEIEEHRERSLQYKEKYDSFLKLKEQTEDFHNRLSASKIEAEARDHERSYRERQRAMLDWMINPNSLTEREHQEYAPTNAAHRDGFILSERQKRMIVGDNIMDAFGDDVEERASAGVIPVTTGNATHNTQDALWQEFIIRPEVIQYKCQPSIVDLVRTIPIPQGASGINMPVLRQDATTNCYGNVQVYSLTEGSNAQATDIRWDSLEIRSSEYAMWSELSHLVLKRSAINLDSFIKDQYQKSFRNFMSDSILNGNGNINGVIANVPAGNQVSATLTAGGCIGWDDIINLKYAVRNQHVESGTYFISFAQKQCLELTVTATEGVPLFNPDTSAGIRNSLAGRPMIANDLVGEGGTTHQGLLYFDPQTYFLGIEREMILVADDSYNRRANTRGYLLVFSAGGQLSLPEAASLLV